MKNLEEVRKMGKEFTKKFQKDMNVIFIQETEKYDLVFDNYFSVDRQNVTKIEKISYKN